MHKELLICFGTRPEWLKVKPLLNVMDNYKLLFTGQHVDLLKDIEVDYRIDIGNKTYRLDQILIFLLHLHQLRIYLMKRQMV